MEHENQNGEEELLLKLEEKLSSTPTTSFDEGGATTITTVLVLGVFTAVCGSFATGCAVGYSSPVQSGVIADLELTTADYSLFGSLLTVGQLIGSLACGKLADYLGRRGTMGLSGTLYLIGWLAITFSQVKVGDDRGCEANLKRLRGENKNISEEANEIKEYTQIVENISDEKFHSLFRRKHAHVLTISLGLMALSRLGGTEGVVFYATTIFESAGLSGAIGTIAMATIQLPPIILGVFLMDNFGRRPLLLSSAVGTCTACFSLALSFLMKEHGWMKDYSPYLALFGILIWSAVYPVGLGGIPYLIMSEIFPMNIKAAAGSLSTIVGALSTTTVSYTFNFLMDWSSSGTFFMYCFINICCLLFISILVPETKGRTLEELQKLLAMK